MFRLIAPGFYARWRAEHLAPPGLHETQDAPVPEERLLQQVWLHQRLDRAALRTLDGRRLSVLHPGFPNREAGPDFRRAVIQLGDGPPQTGDIEIDLEPQGWRQHGHAANPAYRDVRLHVVWAAGARASTDLPTVAIAAVLDAPLPDLRRWLGSQPPPELPPAQTGRCRAPLARVTGPLLVELLGQAALVRLHLKAEFFRLAARRSGPDAALWEGLFAALGYKHNTWPMRRLAELLPRLLPPPQEPPLPVAALQARLLGVAGLLPPELTRTRPSADRRLRDLWDGWWRDRDALADCCLPPSIWRLQGLRPANHPQRRLALAAHWLARRDWPARLQAWLETEVPDRRLAASLLELLQPGPDPFWTWHWGLQGSRQARPQALLGAPRAVDLAINVVLPWLWSVAAERGAAALQQRVEERYLAWPAGEDNAVLRLARQRLFGAPRPRLPARAAAQQGLLQIVRDFCDHATALCDPCRLPDLVDSLPAGE